MFCEYGCNNIAKYILKNGKQCCSKNHQSCPEMKRKNSIGVKSSHKKGLMYKFTKQDRIKSNEVSILNLERKALVKNSNYSNEVIKKIFLKKVEYKCSICNIEDWNGKHIVLELDHINGDNRDNRLENLRLLCPNCHSQTDNFRGRNINNGKKKVSDEELILSLKNSKNIRQALLNVGLTPKGLNYQRAYKLQNLSG